MALAFSEPRIVSRGPYRVVGAWCAYDGDDEGPGWDGAYQALLPRLCTISGRCDDLMLGFLYRPSKDDPVAPVGMRACFVGVEVAASAAMPEKLAETRFSGGDYVLVDCIGDTPEEAAEGVGQAIDMLTEWMPANGYREGDACFAASQVGAPKPPWIETVYIKLERA
ncbi:MAG: GyrI-like domain-containing protein [Chloroflexi bacterium]|nr:GyrI-like domain-containing protein [Chloroflexota bacterium]